MTVGLYLLFAFLIGGLSLRSYLLLEREDMSRQVLRTKKSIQLSVERIASTAGDWAPWDESYNFIEGKDPGYVDDNLSESAFSNLELSLVAFIDLEGSTVWAKAFDLAAKKTIPTPPDFGVFPRNDVLIHHENNRSGCMGLMKLSGNRLMLVASRPITTSNFAAPIVGSLVMGRILDSSAVDQISEQANLSLSISRTDSLETVPDTARILSLLRDGDSTFVTPLNTKLVAGYSMLKDIYGKPAAIIRVDAPRSIYRQGLLSPLVYLLLPLPHGHYQHRHDHDDHRSPRSQTFDDSERRDPRNRGDAGPAGPASG